MIKEPLVSIILVSYNSEKFIEATLDSCIKQSYKNKEILVLDNGFWPYFSNKQDI